jgi:hypothetical protein
MAVNNASKTSEMRQQISSEPDVQPIAKVKVENVYVGEASVKIQKRTLGNAWIVGSSTNGIVGPNTNTQNGLQQVVGGAGREDVVAAVLNSGDKHIQRFNNTEFFDSTNSTGDWNSGNISLTSGETIRSTIIAFNGNNIGFATLNTDNSDNDLTYYLSANDGTNWEEVTPGVQHTFTNTGTKLKWRVDSTGTQSITRIIVSY